MSPSLLIILDGFGYSPNADYNAIAAAHTPFLTSWQKKYPYYLLNASGTAVGLPPGYIGNSQVGHMTIGAGRIVDQPLTIVNKAINNNALASNEFLMHVLKATQKQGTRLHILGLLSDAGVHSHIEHLFAYLACAHTAHVPTIVHSFLDGRDVPPVSASYYLELLTGELNKYPTAVHGSLHGRFYAMDRNKQWDRTYISYATLTNPYLGPMRNWQEVLEHSYQLGITDEFFLPTALTAGHEIRPHDTVLIYNFRPDRIRQIVQSFCDLSFTAFKRSFIILRVVTPFIVESKLPPITLFKNPAVKDTLVSVLSTYKKRIYTIAETEKYAHVTYFLNGGVETIHDRENRILIPSLIERTYESHPCMSAAAITQQVCNALQQKVYDFYIINYANADMVGHSGNFKATVAAIECLDEQLGLIYTHAVLHNKGVLYIVGDHGKAEQMYNNITSTIHTAHTTNPVPFFIINQTLPLHLPLKGLADITPFILNNLSIKVPIEMTGDTT